MAINPIIPDGTSWDNPFAVPGSNINNPLINWNWWTQLPGSNFWSMQNNTQNTLQHNNMLQNQNIASNQTQDNQSQPTYPQMTLQQLIDFYKNDKVNLVFLILPLLVAIFASIYIAPYLLNITYVATWYNLFWGFWQQIVILNYMIFLLLILLIIYLVFKIIGTLKRRPALFLVYFLILWIVSFISIVYHSLFLNVFFIFLFVFIIFFDIFIGRYLFPEEGSQVLWWNNLNDVIGNISTGPQSININISGGAASLDLAEEVMENVSDVQDEQIGDNRLEELYESIKSWLDEEENIKYLYFDNRTKKILGVKIIPNELEYNKEPSWISFNYDTNTIKEDSIDDDFDFDKGSEINELDAEGYDTKNQNISPSLEEDNALEEEEFVWYNNTDDWIPTGLDVEPTEDISDNIDNFPEELDDSLEIDSKNVINKDVEDPIGDLWEITSTDKKENKKSDAEVDLDKIEWML